MIEKNYALKLKNIVQKELINNKHNTLFLYEEDDKQLADCDYKTLQQECKKLDIFIFNLKDSPIFRKENKNMKNKDKTYIVYTNQSLNQTISFKE